MLTMSGYDPSAQNLAVKALGYPGGMISDSPLHHHTDYENNIYLTSLENLKPLKSLGSKTLIGRNLATSISGPILPALRTYLTFAPFKE